MSKKERSSGYSDRGKSIIRHIERQNNNFSVSQCVFHFNKPCFTMLNNFNPTRFHCLYANQSANWKSYTILKSCDIPEHFYDLIVIHKLLSTDYVLPFASHFRESSGYTIGMFQQDIKLYPPTKIDHSVFKETVYTFLVFLCVVCHRLGGSTPNIKYFSFMYTESHPVLCDIGSINADNRERLALGQEHFNKKKWTRFIRRKTIRDVIRYARVVFPHFFQKKKVGKCCILREDCEEYFDTETHKLICQSDKKSLLQVIRENCHLMPNSNIRLIINQWINSFETEDEI